MEALQPEPKPDEPLGHGTEGEHECTCETPVPVERAERRGAARTYCARCDQPVPIRFTG